MNETAVPVCDFTRGVEIAVPVGAVMVSPANGRQYAWCGQCGMYHPLGHEVPWGQATDTSGGQA